MKRKIATLVVILSILFVSSGCGKPKYLGEPSKQVFYPTYGLFNESTAKSKNVCYEISVGNVIWSVLLVESVVFPVYFVGWSIYNPVRLKKGSNDDCTFDN